MIDIRILILCLSVCVVVAESDSSMIDLLIKELRRLEKRQDVDVESLEYYKKVVKDANRVAKDKIVDYQKRKDADSPDDGSTPQKQLDQLHRPKKDARTYEMIGLEREELAIEIQNVTGKTIAELNKIDNFTQAYEDVIRKKIRCPTKWGKTCSNSNTKRYRSEDGTCNNIKNPYWGSAYAAQQRFLDPVYEDGIREPRSKGTDGNPLESPRVISNEVLSSNDSAPVTSKYTVMLMAWGQFIDHTFVFTPTSGYTTEINCCDSANRDRVECLPITIPEDDQRFRRTCMNFTRSSPGPMLLRKCLPEPRQQLNQISSYIDASNVYGSSKVEMDALRDVDENRNLLATLKVAGDNFPPEASDDVCNIQPNDTDKYHCFAAGDVRVNVVPNLQFLHALFVRLHNRLVGKLRALDNKWQKRSEEYVFQETRRIVAAIMQHITYTEYLPKILGEYMDLYNVNENLVDETGEPRDPYNSDINPTIFNGFAAAAFRFGHSQIGNIQAYTRQNYTLRQTKKLRRLFNDPSFLQQDNGERVDEFARWLTDDRAMEVNRFVDEEARNWMLQEFDIASLNIQRGRDHGLPAYPAWRLYCGLAQINGWEDMVDHDNETIALLKTVYTTVHDIDFFVGGISEKHGTGASVGPTFGCIIGKQFERLKNGDRFWYERNKQMDSVVGLTKEQITAIRNVRLSTVICNNEPDILEVQRDVFLPRDDGDNNLATCSTYEDDFDLSQWKL